MPKFLHLCKENCPEFVWTITKSLPSDNNFEKLSFLNTNVIHMYTNKRT